MTRRKTFEEIWAEHYPDVPWPPIGYPQEWALHRIFEVLAKWTEQFNEA